MYLLCIYIKLYCIYNRFSSIIILIKLEFESIFTDNNSMSCVICFSIICLKFSIVYKTKVGLSTHFSFILIYKKCSIITTEQIKFYIIPISSSLRCFKCIGNFFSNKISIKHLWFIRNFGRGSPQSSRFCALFSK